MRDRANKKWLEQGKFASWFQKKRQAAIDALGGECVRCGYDTDIRALEIDHIHGGGGIERKILGNSVFLRRIAEGYTEGYQLLCANCHRIKTFENREYRDYMKKRGDLSADE